MYKLKSFILQVICFVNIIAVLITSQVAEDGKFLYLEQDRIKNFDNPFVCDQEEYKKYSLVDVLSIPESNDFNCHNENIHNGNINDLADSDPESKGYIVPWKFQNQIVTERKSSDICKLIRK
jgi:hypothetical protein